MPVTEYTWDPVTDSILEETDGAGNVLASYTNEPSAYGPLLSQHRGSESCYFHYDSLGSTREITDAGGEVNQSSIYDAWGGEFPVNPIYTTPFMWIGEQGYFSDRLSTHTMIRFRSYAAEEAAFTVKDYVQRLSGLPYAYADNRPTLLLDPSGLLPGHTCKMSVDPTHGVTAGPRNGRTYLPLTYEWEIFGIIKVWDESHFVYPAMEVTARARVLFTHYFAGYPFLSDYQARGSGTASCSYNCRTRRCEISDGWSASGDDIVGGAGANVEFVSKTATSITFFAEVVATFDAALSFQNGYFSVTPPTTLRKVGNRLSVTGTCSFEG